MNIQSMPGPTGSFYVELTAECKCGAWCSSRAKLIYQPITPDRRTGMWVIVEVLLADNWRVDVQGTPHCPVCAGVPDES